MKPMHNQYEAHKYLENSRGAERLTYSKTLPDNAICSRSMKAPSAMHTATTAATLKVAVPM